jgi:hypothetical protein
MKINWKEKIGDSKFWFALVGFITAILAVFNIDNLTVEKVAVIITAGGVLAVYILGDSYVAGKNVDEEKVARLIEEMTSPLYKATDELIKINKRMIEIVTYADERGIYIKKQDE